MSGINKDDLRFTSEQVRNIVGCPESTLKDLTRRKGTRPPFITPVEPAKGSGQKDKYSWGDVVRVGLALELGERKLIQPFLLVASNINHGDSMKEIKPERHLRDPFKLTFLDCFRSPNLEKSKFQEDHLPQITLWVSETVRFFVAGIDEENISWGKIRGSSHDSVCIRKKDRSWVLLEIKHQSASEQKEINETAIVRTSISLNKLHGKLRESAEKLGLI